MGVIYRCALGAEPSHLPEDAERTGGILELSEVKLASSHTWEALRGGKMKSNSKEEKTGNKGKEERGRGRILWWGDRAGEEKDEVRERGRKMDRKKRRDNK